MDVARPGTLSEDRRPQPSWLQVRSTPASSRWRARFPARSDPQVSEELSGCVAEMTRPMSSRPSVVALRPEALHRSDAAVTRSASSWVQACSWPPLESQVASAAPVQAPVTRPSASWSNSVATPATSCTATRPSSRQVQLAAEVVPEHARGVAVDVGDRMEKSRACRPGTRRSTQVQGIVASVHAGRTASVGRRSSALRAAAPRTSRRQR